MAFKTHQFTPVERKQVDGVCNVKEKYDCGNQKIKQRYKQQKPYSI